MPVKFVVGFSVCLPLFILTCALCNFGSLSLTVSFVFKFKEVLIVCKPENVNHIIQSKMFHDLMYT